MKTDYELIKEFLSKFRNNRTSIDISLLGEIIIIQKYYYGYEEDEDDIKTLYNIKILNNKYEISKNESCGLDEDEDLNYLNDINAVMIYLTKELR